MNPEVQRMGNTLILCLKCREQNESHLHFMFYCKLTKLTVEYISELVNLNYYFNIIFKFTLKTVMIMYI